MAMQFEAHCDLMKRMYRMQSGRLLEIVHVDVPANLVLLSPVLHEHCVWVK
jgi:hypothetical protein